MTKLKLNGCGLGCAVAMVCIATVVAAPAQIFTTLADAPGEPFLMSPIQGSDGNFYGTLAEGGDYGYGGVFKITPQGELTTLYSFCRQENCPDGNRPQGALVQATNGDFYGTTENGGVGGVNGNGTIFRITLAGEFTTVYRFCEGGNGCPDGSTPEAGLIQASDGNLYGTTFAGGANDSYGTIFRITLSGQLTKLHSFVINKGGIYPFAGVIQGTDGSFYGTTAAGGFSGDCFNSTCGTIFQMTRSGAFRTIHQFHSKGDGSTPYAGLTQGTDGNFYGATSGGGDLSCENGEGCGTVFKIAPDGTLTTLHTFEMSDGDGPFAAPVQATDGNFYGTTVFGGKTPPCQQYGCGTIYQISPGGLFTMLYDFCNQGYPCADGATPTNGLIQSTDGTLYGTTSGQILGAGPNTVFSLDMGLGPFVAFVRNAAKVGQSFGILGQGLTGTSSVLVNGTPATFTVVSDTLIKARVPPGATTGYVTVTTPTGVLTSNVPFQVIP